MRILIMVSLLAVLTASAAEARLITDMAGRQVEVPERIERVLGAVAPVTWMVYALDPSLLAAFNSLPSARDRTLLCQDLPDLPAIGAFGGTRGIQQEALLSLRPDVVIFWGLGPAQANRKRAAQLAAWGVPAVFVSMNSLDRYPAALRFLGALLNRRERAEQLAAYGDRTLASVRQAVAAIPPEQRRRVYYAEGPDGLETESSRSFHADFIALAGGDNVHQGGLGHYAGRQKVGLEQVLLYDPQVILAQEEAFAHIVANASRWRAVRSVREGRVWRIPNRPLNWFDRPPSFMRFLGIRWLAHRLYPERYPFDEAAETKAFYRCFLGREPDAAQLREILQPPGP